MKRLLLVFAFAIVASGCATSAHQIAPPAIKYGSDACSQCTMTIDDARYAAALQTDGGEVMIFDDIGDMFAWLRAHGSVQAAGMWVHDFDHADWIEARHAFYVVGSDVKTPMDGNVIACRDQSESNRISARHGGRCKDFVNASKVGSSSHHGQ